MINALLLAALFAVGFWGVVARRNLIKKLLALNILNSAVVILYVNAGSRSGTAAPILIPGIIDVVDPVPQALMLTAIVVGLSVTAFGMCLIYLLFRKYGTLDMEEIEREQSSEHP